MSAEGHAMSQVIDRVLSRRRAHGNGPRMTAEWLFQMGAAQKKGAARLAHARSRAEAMT